MRILFTIAGSTILSLIAISNPATAQAPGSAEARLKALNITLPPDSVPAANFVNAVQTGKLLFLSGNTPGAQWPLKGKVGKDLTIEQGYQSARETGIIMLAKIRTHSAASIASSASSRCLAWSTRPMASATSPRW
jgi:hypothetical protein